MEAVPRLPMISFELKQSPEPTSFITLKRYIAECYHEDPESYSKEVHALETLRNMAVRPGRDMDGCSTVKRYYCQLHSLISRFPLISERQLLTFSWREIYSNTVCQVTEIKSEMAAILYNIGALHSLLGSADARTTADGMKLACTHFQCAAWVFGHLRETFKENEMSDMSLSTELLVFMQQLCFAQAQECFLEKSLADNRKAAIIAKVTAQIVSYYNAALAALLTGGDDGAISETVGNKVFKEWKRYVKFKISYLSSILFLYQGQQSEEQQKMGERVTLYQVAFDKLEEARKESKGMAHIDQINEALTFTMDVVEAKRKAAKNENEFIYHEEVPDISTISAIQGANLVKGISFSVTDPEVAGQDIFHRLVPMKAHEGSSLYSEEKATLLRTIGTKIEDRDVELNTFMSSLNVESFNYDNSVKLPQGIVDRCAALHARPNAIPDLVTSMSNLAESCTEVELMLKEIKELLQEEDMREKSYQQTMGARPSGHFAELNREFLKYQEAHNKAGESNETLRKAMGLHVANLRSLAQPLNEIQALVPVCKDKLDDNYYKELQALLSKVNDMRVQRGQLFNTLRNAATNDDITTQIVAWGDKKLDKLFKKELAKHEKTVALIDQNLAAQGNILKALTDCYAKCAPIIKSMTDTKHKREHFFSSLAASYDVYEDLLGKSAKGLEFYRKLQGNVQKLLTRVRAARDVQDEERQQRLKSTSVAKVSQSTDAESINGGGKSGPKLKDYLKSGAITIGGGYSVTSNSNASAVEPVYIPPIRPNPLGSENTSTSTCATTTTSDKFMSQTVTGYQHYDTQPSSMYNYNQSANYMAYNQYNVTPDGTQSQYTNPQQHHLQTQPSQPAIQDTTSIPTYSTGGSTFQSNVQTGYTNPIYQGQFYTTAQGAVTYGNPGAITESSSYGNLPGQATIGGFIQATQQPYSAYSSYGDQSQASLSNTSVNSYTVSSQVTPNTTYSNSVTPGGGLMATATDHQAFYNTSFSNANVPSHQYTSSSYPQTYQDSNQYYQAIPSMTTSDVGVKNPQLQSTSITNLSQQMGSMNLTPSVQEFSQNYGTDYNQSGQNYSQSQPQNDGTLNQIYPQSQYSYGQFQQQIVEPTPGNVTSQATTTQQYSNYQITANNQYVTGYDQSGTVITSNPAEINYTGYDQQTGLTSYSNFGTVYQQPQQDSLSQQTQSNQIQSYASHPGYSFNQLTGEYQYGSGYQADSNLGQFSYSQYTNAGTGGQYSHTTDTTSVDATGQTYQYPTHLESANQDQPSGIQATSVSSGPGSYYSLPYGYHASSSLQQHQSPISITNVTIENDIKSESVVNKVMDGEKIQNSYDGRQMTYINSNHNIGTITTDSNNFGDSSLSNQQTYNNQQQEKQQVIAPQNQTNVPTPVITSQSMVQDKAPQKSSNVDLLSGIDFSQIDIPLVTPPLQPKQATKEQDSLDIISTILEPKILSEENDRVSAFVLASKPFSPQIPATPSTGTMPSVSFDRKLSMDNLSICSEISSIDQNFDWESASVKNDDGTASSIIKSSTDNESILTKYHKNSFEDPKILKWFHKEVERMEKFMEGINIKTLNGTTPLDSKWKELQDLLVKDESKRTTVVAKLFPEKNRSPDGIPYDHARVLLPTTTDDYINAVHVRELGPGCPQFILAQTPMPNTIKDFWYMVWSQKSKTVVCLHTPTEILDTFWPVHLNKEVNYGDFSVTLLRQFDLSYCLEYSLKLTMHGSDIIHNLSLLQIKSWIKNSASHILGIGQNVITTYKQQNQDARQLTPLIMNCLTGSERSGIVSVAITAILATQSRRPILINVVDVWYRICSQRKGALRDANMLQLSLQIVLTHAHDLLNKNGIMTSYQMKMAQNITAIEKEEMKDPLNELDPLWKLKQ